MSPNITQNMTAAGVAKILGALALVVVTAVTATVLTISAYIDLTEVADPAAPNAGTVRVYAKAGKVFQMTSNGNIVEIGALADNAVTAAKLADNAVTSSKIEDGAATVAKGGTGRTTLDAGQMLLGNGTGNVTSQLYSGRNLLHNPNLLVSQRGASWGGVTGTTDVKLSDRWTISNSNAASLDVSRVSYDGGAMTKSGYALMLSVATADASVAAGDYCVLRQTLEGQDAIPLYGKPCVFSFMVSAPAGTYCVGFAQNGGAGSRYYVAEYTVAQSNVWQKVTIPFTFTMSGSRPPSIDEQAGFSVHLTLMAGSNSQQTANIWKTASLRQFATENQTNFCATLANSISFAKFQLETGTVATEFDAPGYGTELLRCQRYYEVCGGSTSGVYAGVYNGSSVSGVSYVAVVPFKVSKRTTPVSGNVVITNKGANGFPDAASTFNFASPWHVVLSRISSNTQTFGYFGDSLTVDVEF